MLQQWPERPPIPLSTPFSSFVVARDEVPQLDVAASSGDPHAGALARVIGKWIETAKALPHEQAPRCKTCGVTFHQANLPAAFAVVLPFAPGQSQSAAAFGICAECVDEAGSNLSDVALEHWRKLWPDTRVLPPGGRA
jgi:hypothetical protein